MLTMSTQSWLGKAKEPPASPHFACATCKKTDARRSRNQEQRAERGQDAWCHDCSMNWEGWQPKDPSQKKAAQQTLSEVRAIWGDPSPPFRYWCFPAFRHWQKTGICDCPEGKNCWRQHGPPPGKDDESLSL